MIYSFDAIIFALENIVSNTLKLNVVNEGIVLTYLGPKQIVIVGKKSKYFFWNVEWCVLHFAQICFEYFKGQQRECHC